MYGIESDTKDSIRNMILDVVPCNAGAIGIASDYVSILKVLQLQVEVQLMIIIQEISL